MQLFKTITACTLAALTLLASSTFYVGLHICQGKVKAVALLHEADGCGHQSLPPCHRKMMENCCDDEQITHEASVVQFHGSSLLLQPAFYLISFVALFDFSETLPDLFSNLAFSVPEHPPSCCGRFILSLIHILRI